MHRSGAVDDVEMRFVARFARFQNWSDNEISLESETVESQFGAATFDQIDTNNILPSSGLNPNDFSMDKGGGEPAPF